MPIIIGIEGGSSLEAPTSFTRRRSVRHSIVVRGPIHRATKESLTTAGHKFLVVREALTYRGTKLKTPAKSSLLVQARPPQKYIAAHSLKVSKSMRDYALHDFSLTGIIETAVRQSQANVRQATRDAKHGVSIGATLFKDVKQSLDAQTGDSFLILADIVSEDLAIGGTDAESSVQVIDLGGATSGTWTAWLNYNGMFLETADLNYNSTALQVQNALLSLDNVPTAESIEVVGGTGGPFTVYFVDAMGHRFISPLVIDIMNLVGDSGAGVGISQAGNTQGSFPEKEVAAQLLVNGSEVLIKDFQYSESVGKLGAFLNVRLLKPYLSQIPNGADIEFNLVVNGTPKNYISSGKLAGRDYRMSWRGGNDGGPEDEVNFSALDVVADKFTLAPRRPVIMFDVNRVSFSNVELKSQDAVRDELGRPILPIYEHIAGLTMRQALRRAYTESGGLALMTALDSEVMAKLAGISGYFPSPTDDQMGLGFEQVVTNIPDYPVKEVRFSIESGWHRAIEPLIGMFNPEYLPVANMLYILNIEYPLPFGALPRIVPMSLTKSLTLTKQFKNDTNAILLTYQMDAINDPLEGLILVHETDTPTMEPNGVEGQPGYTETTTTIGYMRKKRADTLEVVAEVIETVTVETRTIVAGTELGDSGIMQTTHSEVTNNQYYDDLKVGHTKEVKALTLLASATGIIGTAMPVVESEKCSINWVDDPTQPGRKIQASSFTIKEGLVYARADTVTIGTGTWAYRYPILLAQSSGILLADYAAESLGDVATLVIETTQETLRHLQGNQYDNVVLTIDHLNGGAPKRTITAPRTGDTYSNPYNTRSHTQLFRDIESELEIGPRIPLDLNAGELPYNRALELKDQMMNRAKNPLNTLQMPLMQVDFGIAKGSVVVGQTREGFTGRCIVTGLNINGENNKSEGHKITMSLDVLELPEIAS